MTDKMPNPDLAGLTEEEINSFQHLVNRLEDEDDQEDLFTIRERFAASRATAERRLALLERSHSFIKWLNEQTAWQTMSPHRDIGTLVKEIAAELREGGA